jgi:hypothetical protein
VTGIRKRLRRNAITATFRWKKLNIRGERMNLKKLSSEKQVKRLKSLLRSGEKTTTSHIAVSAFKHNLIIKEHGETVLKPVLRWYLGQLAKEYIKKHFKEAKEHPQGDFL